MDFRGYIRLNGGDVEYVRNTDVNALHGNTVIINESDLSSEDVDIVVINHSTPGNPNKTIIHKSGNAKRRLHDSDKGMTAVHTLGGKQRVGIDNEPWFVLSDVMKVLYLNTNDSNKTKRRLDQVTFRTAKVTLPAMKGVGTIYTPWGRGYGQNHALQAARGKEYKNHIVKNDYVLTGHADWVLAKNGENPSSRSGTTLSKATA